jgi:hypothetical protein
MAPLPCCGGLPRRITLVDHRRQIQGKHASFVTSEISLLPNSRPTNIPIVNSSTMYTFIFSCEWRIVVFGHMWLTHGRDEAASGNVEQPEAADDEFHDHSGVHACITMPCKHPQICSKV